MKTSVLVACLAIFVGASEATAATLLDQQTLNSGSASGMPHAGDCCTHIAQTFTAGITGDLVAVGGLISHEPSLTLEIRAIDYLGQPTGPTLSTTTIIENLYLPENSGGPGAKVILSQPVPVIRGNRYALVASAPGGYVFWNASSEPYFEGSAWILDPTLGWRAVDADFTFRTYVDNHIDPASVDLSLAKVRVTFSGLTTNPNDTITGIPWRTPVTGRLEYAAQDQGDSDPNPQAAGYDGIVRIQSVRIGEQLVGFNPDAEFPNRNQVRVGDFAYSDWVGISASFFPIMINGWRPFLVSLSLSDTTDSVITGTQLPLQYSLSEFDGLVPNSPNSGLFILRKSSFSSQANISFSLTRLDAVLIPYADTDADGRRDDLDNCPDTPNLDQTDSNSDGIGDACAGTTPTGGGVVVNPVAALPTGGQATVELTFDSVQSGGTTTISAEGAPIEGEPETPPAFQMGVPPLYYDVSTTAAYTGPVALCFSWAEGQYEDESTIRLFHYEDDVWNDVTTSRDTTNNRICGLVTTLSPFALFESAYRFAGFFAPVDNRPVRNTVKAGSAVPVKFSLTGDQGLTIFAASYPTSQAIGCDTSAPTDVVEETISPEGSSLTYDAGSDRYSYVWKTQKAWSGSCRRLTLRFLDGSEETADFGFSK